MKILDANAKIGNGAIYTSAIGARSKHEKTSQNGKFLIDLARERNMTIGNKLKEKKYRKIDE